MNVRKREYETELTEMEVQPIRCKKEIERMKRSLHGRDLLLFIIGINTNLRISDILPLTREDFDGDHIRVKEKKTGKYRLIRINDSIRKAIAELAPDSGYLFPSRKGGKPISTTQAYRRLTEAAERAGLPYNFGTHSMRKTWALHAYKNGQDLATIQKALNHSSQRETLRYIGIVQDTLDNLFDSVNL